MSQPELIRVCMKGTEAFVSFAADHINQFESARLIGKDFCDLFEHGMCQSHPIDQISVDLTGIDKISSVGLNGLVQMNSKSRSHGVRMILTNVPSSVREVFKLTRMERMFEFDSETAAVVPSL